MYFIEEGTVSVRMDQDDAEVEISQLGKGQYFGELALVTHRPRAASVYATGGIVKLACECPAEWRVWRNAYTESISADPSQQASFTQTTLPLGLIPNAFVYLFFVSVPVLGPLPRTRMCCVCVVCCPLCTYLHPYP